MKNMGNTKKSFLSNLLGQDNYRGYKVYAKRIVVIGTCILGILLLLSSLLHLKIISELLSLCTGTSIVFIAYIAALILFLDVEVDLDQNEDEPEASPKQFAYKLTIIWGLVLIIIGFSAIYFSNKYRKHYAFECRTFLVEKQTRTYHLDYNNHCEIAAKCNDLVEMKGYEIEDANYTFCVWCRDWADDIEMGYQADKYTRR